MLRAPGPSCAAKAALPSACYVQTTEEEEPIDVAEEMRKLKELQARRDEAEAKMMGFRELGYES